MKRNGLSLCAAVVFILYLALPSWAWQGRMAGVGDAAGLIEDEADYLTHPAGIASGKGFNAYGSYRLTYDKTTRWDYSANAPTFGVTYPYSSDGYQWKHGALIGAAFGLGAGRMGVFFDYAGARGKYKGDEPFSGFWGPGYNSYELNDRLDNFALKVLYGLPVNSVKVGGELQIAYRSAEQETFLSTSAAFFRNFPWAAEDNPAWDLYPFMIPYDSKYWEAIGKASVAGTVGGAKYAFTLQGGLPFAGDNAYSFDVDGMNSFNAEGKVKGFHVGGDFWLRVPVSERLALPFVVSAGYKTIKRDGSYVRAADSFLNYEHEARDFFVKVGGGADFTPAAGKRFAAGLYYDYLRSKQKAIFEDIFTAPVFYVDNYADMPDTGEHRLTLKAVAEMAVCPRTTLRGGVNAFYGRVNTDFSYAAVDDTGPYMPLKVSTRGWTAGVNAALGATVKMDRFELEPFVNAGYTAFKTSGDGTVGPAPVDVEIRKDGWQAGGGLAVKF
ncbi:MAG: hypothetical protein EG826_16165 [Deltaproteobacteria bacterium]|nr:hypothetical protein [Deltaproteobacteria bacterium]